MNPLATAVQRLADAAVAEIVADPAVQAVVDAACDDALAGRRLSIDADADRAYFEGLARNRAYAALCDDPANPVLLNPMHDQARMGLDNPDTIYRQTAIDPTREYRLVGQRNTAVDVSFQVLDCISGDGSAGSATGFLDGASLVVEPDGTFEVTVTSEPQGRTNELVVGASSRQLIVRDTLGDWSVETPMKIEIETAGGTQLVPTVTPDIVARTVALFRSASAYWPTFVDVFHSGVGNAVTTPFESPFGLTRQFSSVGSFDVSRGRALVLTVAPTDWHYFGIQLGNDHFVSLDHRGHPSSRNLSQTSAGPDGSMTFVVGSTDPGVANWLDTTGLTSGVLCLRWQGRGAGRVPLEVDTFTCGIGDIEPSEKLPPVTPAERADELRRREAAYDRRREGLTNR